MPRLLITLDYELFFGQDSGSVENCLLRPTDALLKVLDAHNAKVVMFVDAGYLVRLEDLGEKYPRLKSDHNRVCKHLQQLSEAGHDIQLHIHPHWEDTDFDGEKWTFNTERYRLHNFDKPMISSITRRYVSKLRSVSSKEVFVYRAGGWCIQPFDQLKDAFLDVGVWLDSTVFTTGLSTNQNREFNFTSAPVGKDSWTFSDDPVQEDSNGKFVEIPISSIGVSPAFYWKMAFMKFFPKKSLKIFGDGYFLANSSEYYLDRLTKFSTMPASIDGAKAGLLNKGYRAVRKRSQNGIYNVMGHPKMLTPYSISKLDVFLRKNKEIKPITFQDLISLKP